MAFLFLFFKINLWIQIINSQIIKYFTVGHKSKDRFTGKDSIVNDCSSM